MAVRTDSGSFPGVAVSAADRTDTHVVGWDRELTETGHCLRAPGGPRLVLVRGERGAGRSAFAHAVAAGLRADGVEVLALTCVAGDEAHPLLLALRLTALARERRPATGGQRAAGGPGAEALAAVERGDRAVLADALRAALAHVSPVVVVVDDAQYADAASLAVLRGISTGRSAADVRLLLTVLRHDAVADSLPTELPHGNGPLEPVATGTTPHTIVLPRLAPGVVAELVALRVKAAPDTLLARQAHRLTRGIPAVVEALLTGWSRQGAIRVADGHAFLDTGSAVPALPDDDRCLAALHATGEPCRTVAGALSVLWPLGRRAAALVARSTGLSGKEVDHGIRHLVAEGILDELHAADGAPVRGWRFRAPLVEHAVRERLGPLERRRLSAAAVEAVWATQDSADAGDGEPGAPALVEEADARTYLPDRIADAGSRVDRERAVRELSSAAQRLHPDPEGLGMLRWLRAALRLVEEPATRQLALLRYAKAAYVTGDHLTVRNAAQALLRSPDEGVTAVMLQDAASLLVGSIAAEDGRPRLSRMASPQWWESLRLPDLAVVPGRVLALCLAEKWQEALDLLAATEGVWDTDPLGRLLPRLYRSVAELVSGRPERFERDLALPMGGLPPDTLYAVTLVQVDRLLDARDLSGATALLAGRGLDHGSLPPYTRFLVSHLQGRWDDALERARRMVAHHQVVHPTVNHHLLTARMAGILLAQGRTTGATRLIDAARGRQDGPLEASLDHAEAEVLRTLGNPAGAEQALRRGLASADARGHVHGTEELWAALADLLADEGRLDEAAACLRRVERIVDRTGNGRARLLHLLGSARLTRDRPDEARRRLLEAVELARSRAQPFETAVTLLTAAAAGAGPADTLLEAYELFGEIGSALWRSRTRAAMREVGRTVPGRKQATAENERLLAVLLAEGLSNRHIATVLGLSEDAVANRLTRLFARTGLRSRAKVVKAVLTGRPLTDACA